MNCQSSFFSKKDSFNLCLQEERHCVPSCAVVVFLPIIWNSKAGACQWGTSWMEVRSFASLNAVLDDLALHSVLVSSLVSRQKGCSGWRTPASWEPWGFDKQVAPPSDFQWSQYANKEILPVSKWWWAVGQVRTGPRSGFTIRPERSILSSFCLMVLKCQCFMLTLVSSGFPLAPARPSPFSLSFSVAHTEVGDQ